MKTTSFAQLLNYLTQYYFPYNSSYTTSSFLYHQGDFAIKFDNNHDALLFSINFGKIENQEFILERAYMFQIFNRIDDSDLYNYHTFHNEVGLNSVLNNLQSNFLYHFYHLLSAIIKESDMIYLNESLNISSQETKYAKL